MTDPGDTSPLVGGAAAGEDHDPDLMSRVAGSTVSLAGRRVVLTALSGVSVAFVARLLGPTEYGQLAAAIATFTLLLALSDFGFTLTLSRDLAKHPENREAILRAAFQVQSVWALVLALALVVLALATGIDSGQGQALLVLAPAVLVSGLVSARAVFAVTYTVHRLVMIDLIVTAGQVVLMIAAAAVGLGPAGVAAAVGLGYAVNAVLAAIFGYRIVRGASPDGSAGVASRMMLLRRVLPLGLMGFMVQVYLTIDVAILGWLVTGPSLGNYAAASKMLAMLASISGLAVGAALPAFSTSADRPAELMRITTRVWHWLVAAALPCFVGAAVFAPLAVTVTVGHGYESAATYLRILSLAGIVGVSSTFFGHILVAQGRVRPLLIQNAIAVVANIGGNLVFVPRYGVVAAAWITVLTEVIVCVGALITLRTTVSFGPWAAVAWRPLLALAGATLVAVALNTWTVAALIAAVITYGLLSHVLHSWPPELGWRAVRRGPPRITADVAPGAPR